MTHWKEDTEVHDFVCEVDGFTAHLTNQEAFDAGWDYPPFIGDWGIIAPRTCPDHGMEDSAWWAIQTGQELTPTQRAFCESVAAEEREK